MKKILFFTEICVSLFANPLEFQTLASNFTQSVQSDGKTINYEGNFLATRQKALWQYKKPNIKNIYFSSTKVVVIEPDLEQAILTNLKNTPNLTAILASAKPNSRGIYEAKLDGITYNIEVKNDLPSAIYYTDKLDNKVTIKLKNLTKNPQINENLLTPVIPKNYDIVTQ